MREHVLAFQREIMAAFSRDLSWASPRTAHGTLQSSQRAPRQTPRDRGPAGGPRGGWRAPGRPGRWSARRPPPRAAGARATRARRRRPRGRIARDRRRRVHAQHPPEQRGVDHPPRHDEAERAQARTEEGPLHPGDVHDGNPAPAARARAGRGPSGPRGAAARSAALRPWISTDAAGGEFDGRTRPVTVAAATTRPPSTGTTANEMTSSVRGSSPVVSMSTTANGRVTPRGAPATLSSAPELARRRARAGLAERPGTPP